ncbi:hypothetical protein BDZ89DRAFT_1063779 [Hymenopellis radicata]|nr:hypothetical protein BDZ89DRAFT_1063779 [Hymenopellis radicata]
MSDESRPAPGGDDIDWETLKKASLFPGGFGAERRQIWPKLLRVPLIDEDDEKADTSESTDTDPHVDERQIQLDTDRSFVLYPVDDAKKDRESLQEELHRLLVAVFRKRPKLSYFQGYHDIITVLFLTLPSEVQLACAEQISLHRIRDSMGLGLEPVLGLLRVMQNLLRTVDSDYAELLERTSPLPFYALSNLLTLFSHDMPTLPLIQHVFDYVLCRPPIIVVYLATAVVLARKDEVRRLEEEDEDGMIHSLLSGLPNITDGELPPSELIPKEEAPDEETLPPASDLEPKIEELEPELPSKTDSLPPIEETASSNGCADPNVPPAKSEEDVASIEPKVEEIDPAVVNDPPPSHFIEPTHRKPTITLASLLLHADEMYETYPPSHPSLSLSSIMGPQSVVFTWSTSCAEMPSDDAAERMVEQPELTVFPPPTAPVKEKEAERSRKRKPRKLYKRPPSRRTMIAAAVLVLGIAMAFYGVRSGLPAIPVGKGHGRHGMFLQKEWARLGGWMRSLVVGGGRFVEL